MILILIGESGSGKSAVAAKLVSDYGYTRVRPATTRKHRDGEPKDAYYFMSVDEFKEHLRNDDFVEFDIYNRNNYGTLKTELEGDQKKLCVLTPEGAQAVKREFPDAYVAYIHADMKTAVSRAVSREKELTPEILQNITDRAVEDYRIFQNVEFKMPTLVMFHNTADSSLDEIVKVVAETHESHMALIKRTKVVMENSAYGIGGDAYVQGEDHKSDESGKR